MKNRSIENIKSKVKIAIKGKNINRFLLRLHKNGINILNVEKINKDEAYILIYFKDYEAVLKHKTIYEVFIVSYGGWEQNKRRLNKNKLLILSITLSIIILMFLSRLIFKVEIITNDTVMRDKLLYDLSLYDIEKFKFQKSYSDLQIIKEKLLKKYKEEIEWLEIELVGTKYILKYEPRIVNDDDIEIKPRHIISKKNAIIYSVMSSKGQIVKYKNDYVSKGDIVVSGEIKLNDEVKDIVASEGKVYGEVWYEVEVFYPFGYYEQTKTGRKKKVYVIKFLNKRIELFNFNDFYDKIIEENVIISESAIPLKLVVENQIEVKTKSSIQSVEEAEAEAISLALAKMKNKLNDNEYIIKYRVINRTIEGEGVRLNIFFSVVEDITDYEEIIE